jgi:rhomboid protease GluP
MTATTLPRLLRPQRLPLLTLLLMLANIGLYLWQIAHGVDAMSPDLDMLTDWGANIGALTLTGDPWRLLSSMFLHIGAMHLLLNMVSLLFMGSIVELNFGRLNFLILYLITGLGGSLASALYHAMPASTNGLAAFLPFARPVLTLTVSAGASGAVMGLAAAAIALRVVDAGMGRETVHPFKGKEIFLLVVINIIYGWQTEGTDNACHVGGLVTGLVLGLILAASINRGLAQRLAIQVVVAVAALGGIWYGVNSRQSDADLMDIREQLSAQQKRDALNAEIQAQRAAAEAEAVRDATAQPAAVDEAQAQGVFIPVSDSASQFLLGPGGKHAYVTDAQANTLSVVDMATQKVIKTIQGGKFARGNDGCTDNYCRGLGAKGVVVSADESRAWVASMRPNAIATVDLASGKVTGSIPAGRYPTQLVAAADGKMAYAFNSGDDTISFLDLAAGKPLSANAPIYGGQQAAGMPFGRRASLVLSHDERLLYMNSDSDSSVVVMDTLSRKPVERFAAPDGGVNGLALSEDGKTLSVLNSAGITQVDTQTYEPANTLTACGGLDNDTAFLLSADGQRAAIWQGNTSAIRIVKLSTHKTLGLYPAGQWPTEMFFTAQEGKLLTRQAGGLRLIDLGKRVAEEDPQADFFCWPKAEDAS